MKEENVIVGPKLHLPVPDTNVGKYLFEKLKQRNNNEIAFKNHVTEDSISVGKVLNDSVKLAKCVMDFVVRSDSVVAICADNNIHYPTVVLASLYAGTPLALMNPAYTTYELQQLLNIVKPEIMFCSKINVEDITNLQPKINSIKKIVVIDSEEKYGDCDSLTLFLENKKVIDKNFQIKDVHTREHLAFILFSSGTTGLSKAVTMTHFSVTSTLIAIENPAVHASFNDNVALGVLPFFHITGFYQILISLQKQKQLIILEHFNPFDYLRCIEKYKISQLMGVPPLLQFLAKSPIIDEFDLTSLKEVTCGSAPISEHILQAVKKRFNLRSVRQAYGSTEAHTPISTSPPDRHREGSVGLSGPGTSIVIRDVETGRNLPAFQSGEICIKSDMMMKGYYNNEEATRSSFTKDGWLKTGDIGYYDKEEYLYVVDRLKELIKYKGFQVAPAELEAVLLRNPKIADAGVIGRPDVKGGEVPVAFVVKQPDVELTEDQVKDFVAKFLNKNKQLHGGVLFVDEIPRTRSGKIVRRELKKILENITKAKL